VHDDDDDSLLAKLPDVGAMGAAYREAYVLPVYDVGDYNMNVPFALNVQDTQGAFAAMDWDSRSQNATSFWVAYVLAGFQGPRAPGPQGPVADSDPNSETALGGATVPPPSQGGPPGGGSLVFLEGHQVHEGYANPISEEQITVVHESGHAVANNGDEPVTGNNNRDPTFTSKYLDLIRSSTKPLSGS
jgi:hypothetical protein